VQSNQALSEQLAKYDAVEVNTRLSDTGYYVVEYSVAPGLRLSVMIATLGIPGSEVSAAGAATLTRQTGQKVTK
jgi:hypothetical protein